jgi:putative transposase
MTAGADIRRGRHCVFVLHAHVVFVTKYRHPVFCAAHLERMEEIMRDVGADFGCELTGCNGEADHVHLLVNFPHTVTVSRLVNSLKVVSSRRLRQEFPRPAAALLAGQAPVVRAVLCRTVGGALISVTSRSSSRTRRPDVAAARPYSPPA